MTKQFKGKDEKNLNREVRKSMNGGFAMNMWSDKNQRENGDYLPETNVIFYFTI